MNTNECAWHQTSITLLTRKLTGLRGFEFEKDVEKEYLYASGKEPIDIQEGNNSYPLTLKLLKFELDLLNDAALAAGYADLAEVPHELIAITCVYKKSLATPARTIVASGVAFKHLKFALEQNAKFTEVSIPGIAMKTVIK